MILYIISDNTARRVKNPDLIPYWSAEYHNIPGFYWDRNYHLICVLDTLERLVSIQPVETESQDGLESFYFYTVLFEQSDKEFQYHPDTGSRICYRYLHPLEYIFES